ncbi:50S ribosomal protein L18 [Pseudodesulfovibrio piezophilus]|uniref:Large ribosomal subunit protein uL18 n=1 Tax=Pseudodesulfovibrio piezophilus (strain DSM 21447 / JCM 15486 / C1TLV30) TaxID=1322246 RepID=M1WL13_PSEP2|nr:50S ribosomal protein L18 [Pseudodesulfovibrio piezophilus]CCH50546.1 50S ribosomal protein L18 [Pseudodesulfovibrio piezophilus C1TLV30]
MSKSKNAQRLLRKPRIRKKISGTEVRPRLVVFRSNQHLYAQLVDDVNGVTLAASSTQVLGKEGEALKANKDSAALVGKDIATKALEKKIESVVFDRNGYIYHGKVKALADGAREGGLKF